MSPRRSTSDEPFVALLWLPDTESLAVVAGQWRRTGDGSVEAWYGDREELEACVWAMRALRGPGTVDQDKTVG